MYYPTKEMAEEEGQKFLAKMLGTGWTVHIEQPMFHPEWGFHVSVHANDTFEVHQCDDGTYYCSVHVYASRHHQDPNQAVAEMKQRVIDTVVKYQGYLNKIEAVVGKD